MTVNLLLLLIFASFLIGISYGYGAGLTVTNPNGGESLQAGTTYAITWADNISENVRIWLIKGGQGAGDITTSTTSIGSYSWTIPTDITPGTDYQIGIQSVMNPSVLDYSDYRFSIGITGSLSENSKEVLMYLNSLSAKKTTG